MLILGPGVYVYVYIFLYSTVQYGIPFPIIVDRVVQLRVGIHHQRRIQFDLIRFARSGIAIAVVRR